MERIAWGVFAVIILLALLGFTGADGPAARSVTAADPAVVEYPRIARWGARDTIAVTLRPATGQHEIALSQDFVRGFEVEQIFPEPSESLMQQGAHVLRFEAAGTAPATVTFFVRVRTPGFVNVGLTVDRTEASFSTFVLP